MKVRKNIPVWKNKTIYEKILNIIGMIIAFSILVLAFLEIFEIYESINLFEFLLGLLMLVQAFQYWKYDRKSAILFLVLSLFILICYLIIFFIK